MELSARILAILTCGLLALGGAGCKRQAAYHPAHTLDAGLVQLREALATASPDVQRTLYSVILYDVRYGRYSDALTALDQVESNPGLNNQQKRVASDVAELLKQKIKDQQNAATSAG